MLSSLNKKTIAQIACGETHSLALTGITLIKIPMMCIRGEEDLKDNLEFQITLKYALSLLTSGPYSTILSNIYAQEPSFH